MLTAFPFSVLMVTPGCVMCADATAANDADAIKALSCWPHLASGSGREASVYRRYIVDEYDHGLADTTVFIHGHA
jgi:Protein of unknown function (DUF3431)